MRGVSAVMAVLVVLAAAGGSAGVVPQTMSYQGVLTGNAGGPVPDDDYSMEFSIYDVPDGGDPLWEETQTVEVSSGIFDVVLGSLTPLDIAFDVPYWLNVRLESGPDLMPRIELTAAPYAQRAAYADEAEPDDDWDVSGANVVRTTGNVGIGTATPAAKLDVAGTTRTTGLTMQTGAADGYVLTTDAAGNASWQEAGAGTGDITAVIADEGLTGGAASGDAYLSVGEGDGIVVALDEVSVSAADLAGDGLVADGHNDLDVNVGVGLRIADGKVELKDEYVTGTVYDPRFVEEGEVDAVSTAMIFPDVVGSLDGVANDGGDIDLVAGPNVTITPDDGANTITISSTGGDDGDWVIDGGDVYRSSGNVGVGTTTPGTKLDVVGTARVTAFRMPTGAADGFVLTTDGVGRATWQQPVSGSGDITAVYAGDGLAGGAEIGDATLDVNAGLGLEIADDDLQLTANYLTGGAYDYRFVNDGEANVVTADMIIPNVVGSVDGVTNDAGDIDLIAGSNVTITPDDGANTITISAEGGEDADWLYDGADIYRVVGSVGIGATPRGGGESEGSRERGSDRGVNKLYVTGGNQKVLYARLYDTDDLGTGRAAIYGYRSRSTPSPGVGYHHFDTNNAITGYNLYGDAYTFGVAGYTWYDANRTGGVLGSSYDGTTWAALGYRDESAKIWGVYTEDDAHVGGFEMPTGAEAGHVLTSDGSGEGTWQPASGGIGGTGVSNYVTKFTGSQTIGSSSIFNAGTTVGIGTQTPEAALDVRRPSEGEVLHVESSYGGANGKLINLVAAGAVFTSADMVQIVAPSNAPDDFQFLECERGVGNVEFSVDGDGRISSAGGADIDGPVDVVGDVTVTGTVDVTSDTTSAGSFWSSHTGDDAHVVHAEHTGDVADNVVAIYGKSVPADYYGLGGYFEGGYVGVSGYVGARGVGDYYGVRGRVTGGSGTNCGIYGYAIGSGVNRGVYGTASGGTASHAGYFAGDVHVTGTLTKGGGAFKIDHPLDPANRYLYHSFVESPDMKNIYDGVTVLDAQGMAWVDLPEWFEAVNRDFRYQLTAIGAPGPNLYVADEIAGNRFRIAGGDPGMKVSWMITGIRHDPYAEVHRVPVEEDKPSHESGKYLHPEAYGLPPTMAVDHEEEQRIVSGRAQSESVPMDDRSDRGSDSSSQ